jgi:hypothetical protein
MNDPESLIQPHEYLKYIYIFIKYISYPNLRPFIMENAIGYFFALGLTLPISADI